MFKLIVVALCVTIVGLFVMTKIDPNVVSNTGNVVTTTTSLNANQVRVIITGQILYPGEYVVDKSDSLGDLIEKAGGTLDDADLDSFNEDLTIGDYKEFYISPLSKTPDTCIVETITKVNINTATAEQLQSIGLSSTLASAVVAYRNANGDFETIEDIQNVSGIGTKTYQNIRDYITIK